MFGDKAIQIPLVAAVGNVGLMVGIVIMHYMDHHNWRWLPWVNLAQHVLVIGLVSGYILVVSLIRRDHLRELFRLMFSIKRRPESPWNDTRLLVLMYIIAASWFLMCFVWWLTRLLVNTVGARHACTSTVSDQEMAPV